MLRDFSDSCHKRQLSRRLTRVEKFSENYVRNALIFQKKIQRKNLTW